MYSLKITAVFAVVFILTLPGCAVTYVDSSGYEHSIGLIHQKVNVKNEILYIEKRSLGLNIGLSETDGGITLGYKNSTRVFAPEDTKITVDNRKEQVIVDIDKYE